MKKRSILVVVVALCGILALACGGGGGSSSGGVSTQGAVQASIANAGGVDGMTGNFIVTVKNCGPGGSVLGSDTSRTGITLTSGTVYSIPTIANIATGSKCVHAYLDVNTNSSLESGDIVASAGEVGVTISTSLTATVNIHLDQIQP